MSLLDRAKIYQKLEELALWSLIYNFVKIWDKLTNNKKNVFQKF